MAKLNNIIPDEAFSNLKNLKSIRLGVVTSIDPIPNNTDDKKQSARNKRYNADPFILRARVLGAEFDRDEPKENLPNAYPLIPKHFSAPPKPNELVLLLFFSDDLKNSTRLYIGPMISSQLNFFKDVSEDATASLDISHKEIIEDIAKIPETQGVYPTNKDISIHGRNNADICFDDNEVRIRAGKFVVTKGVPNPRVYNEKNPAYVQIKYDVPLERQVEGSVQKRGSVTNIVASKINLLGVETPVFSNTAPKEGTSDYVNLADREKLITDEGLISILENAEPVMFGNPMMMYLDKLEKALASHKHNGLGGATWTNKPGEDAIANFENFAKQKRELILSKNIKIN